MNNDFLNIVYDIVAQNTVTQSERDEVTELIDYVDLERKVIIFKIAGGSKFELQLVETYAPSVEE